MHFDLGYRLALSGSDLGIAQAAFAAAPDASFAQPLEQLQDDSVTLNTGLTLARANGLEVDLSYNGVFGGVLSDAHSLRLQLGFGF